MALPHRVFVSASMNFVLLFLLFVCGVEASGGRACSEQDGLDTSVLLQRSFGAQHAAANGNEPMGITTVSTGTDNIYVELDKLISSNRKVFIISVPLVVLGVAALVASWWDQFFFVSLSIFLGFSICLNILNKSLAELGAPVSMLMLQMLFAVIGLVVGVGWRLLPEMQAKSSNVFRCSFITLPFAGLLITSMVAFKTGAVVEIVTLRNLIPLFMFFAEKIFLGEDAPYATAQRIVALLVIAIGSASFVHGDHTLSVSTVVLVLLNMMFAVTEKLLTRKFLVDPDTRLSFLAMTFVNNLLGILPVVAVVFISKENLLWPQLFGKHGPFWHPAMLVFFLLSAVAGIGLAWSSFAIQKNISATSFSVLQTASKVFIIALAALSFGETMTRVSFFGCFASLGGCLWYSLASLNVVEKSSSSVVEK